MATLPFALSIHHFISSVGADAGFAAIIGLAILVLLFFSQARETANLRQRAEEAEEALSHLEMRLNTLGRTVSAVGQTAPAVAAAPAAARTSGRPGVAPAPAIAASAAAASAGAGESGYERGGSVATIPAAPAGVGAPALSSATRLIPLGAGDGISIRSLRESDGPAEGAAANGNGGHGSESNGDRSADDAARNGGAAAPVPAAEVSDPPPPPSTAAGGAARPAPVAPVAAAPAAPASTRPRSASSGAPTRGSAPLPRRDAIPGPRQWRPGRIALVLGALLAVAAIVLVLNAVLSSGGSSHPAASRSTRTTTAHPRAAKRSTTAAVSPASVPVAVLNGTSTPHLAHSVMAKLTSFGYKQAATPTTASNQTLTATIVGYASPADRPEALAVARSLGLSAASVRPVSSGDRSVACSATPTACPAHVFVTVGSDLSALG